MNELVSICLLTYNHEKYIEDAIRGILSQTYDNIELFILDDHSNDDTVAIINSWNGKLLERFKKVTIQVNPVNTGNIPGNCNLLVKQANGSYIKLMAGDDIFLSNGISDIMEQCHKHPDADIVYANGFVEDDSYHYGDDYSWNLFQEKQEGYEREDFLLYMMFRSSVFAPSAIVKREFYETYGYYDEEVGYEDFDLWLRALENKRKLYYFNKPVVIYRRTPNSISNRKKGDVEPKLIFAIKSEINSKKKHIDFFNEEEKNRIWESTYDGLRRECEMINSDKCRKYLDEMLPRFENRTYDNPNGGEVTVKKLQAESAALGTWVERKHSIDEDIKKILIEYKKVAIYGYARLGRVLLQEVQALDGCVEVIIDRQGKKLYAPIPVCSVDEIKELNSEIVIITVLNGYSAVKEMLLSRFPNIVCINIMNIIYGLNDM